MRPADTCPAKGEAPARPGRKTERPQTGHRRATGPAAGAGKAAGAGGDYTVAGRGSAASNRAARPCWAPFSNLNFFVKNRQFFFFAIELMNIQ